MPIFILRHHRAMLTALLLALLPMTASAGQDEHGDHDKLIERKLMVEVPGGVPRVWSFGNNGYLGIDMIELTPQLRTHFGVADDVGVMLSSIEDGSPASKAGLEVGDILTAIDGEAVTGRGFVMQAIGSHDGGETVTIEVFRDGGYRTLSATLAERERPQMWLNRIGEDAAKFEFRTEDGNNVFVLPGPDEEHLHLRSENLNQVMGTLQDRLASPDFQNRMLQWRSNTEQLEARIEELEQRLKELATKLEKIER